MVPLLGSFIADALAHLGVEHAWIAEDRLRVRRHPLLEAVFHDAASLDFALTEAALEEHPGSIPCFPGSHALELLLEAVRRGPAGFRSRLEGAASLPAGAGPLEGGNLQPAATAAGTRALELVTVALRITVRADEQREHLALLSFRPNGTPVEVSTDRIQGLERVPLTAAPAALPDGLLDAVERAALEAGEKAAGELAGAVEERKRAEAARLEEYLRSLRDELDAALPPGPARQIARVRTDARARLATLRTVLEGVEIGDKKALLEELWPSTPFWETFRGRKPPPGRLAHLDPGERDSLHGLLHRLPARFSLEEAEMVIARDEERRLQRMEDGASALELLEQRERMLEAEHQERVADIERKHQVRVSVRPVLLEWLEYTAPELRLSAPGLSPLTACWDPVLERWVGPHCPTCAAECRRLWRCDCGRPACGSCASVCTGCGSARCSECAWQPCAAGGEPACSRCGRTCDRCGGWECGHHAAHCPECRTTLCPGCGAACGECGRALCPAHQDRCLACELSLCPEHGVECSVCGSALCSAHAVSCDLCGHRTCADHRVRCRLCEQEHCPRCVDGLCETCRSLEPVGSATADALRSRLAQLAPEADLSRAGGWKLGKNRRYWVVTGRRWPWRYTAVLADEGETLVSVRKKLRLL